MFDKWGNLLTEYMVRVGDQGDYIRGCMDEAVELLQAFRVRGPLTPYVCTTLWASPSTHGKIVGIESEEYYGDRNYISLFVVGDDGEFLRSITVEELAELNRRIRKVSDDYRNGECPDCGLEIPSAAQTGQACEDCGHIFTENVPDDDTE